jgi:spore maturation protein CgeB
MSRFLPPKTQRFVIKYKTLVFRYLRFFKLTPLNWIRFISLARKNPKTFVLSQKPQREYKIACILDEFSFESFNPEATFLQLDVNHWKSQIIDFQPDIILIESAWKGKNSGWARKISEISNEIIELASWGDQNNIPTIFWHKEVPPHFKTFMHVTRLFDAVFLTDADCIDAYKKKVGHQHVYFLSFACQPIMHNPIQEDARKHSIIYAGTFYPEYKYPERHKNFMDLYDSLSPLIEFDIYDRMAGKGNYTFPEKFHKHIKGSLPFSEMSKAYRSYEYGLNMNSVKHSTTMCSRRVFELIACNTLVIGNYSNAVRNIFGKLTICSDDRKEILDQFKKLESDSNHKKSVQLNALRKVMEEYTYKHNLQMILSTISTTTTKTNDQILIVGLCQSQKEYDSILENFNRQNFSARKLLIINDNKSVNPHNDVLMSSSTDFINHWNNLKNQFSYVGVFHPDWFYGAYYLTDLIHGLTYSCDGIATKASFYSNIDGNITIQNPKLEYYRVSSHLPYHSICTSSAFNANILFDRIQTRCISIDAFNLCQNTQLSKEQIEVVEGQCL